MFLYSVDRLTQSANFENLFKSNQTLLPKDNLFPIDYSTAVQIYRIHWGLEVFVVRVQTEPYNTISRQVNFSGFSLTISPLWNSISSLVLGVSVWMSPRSEYYLCRSPWSTSCSTCSFGAFAIRDAISLSNHNSVKSVWPEFFWIIQNPRRFGWSYQNEKCSKLYFLAPRNCLDFFSPFLTIVINFLKLKTDLAFLNFYFKLHFEFEKVPMAKVVHFFKSYHPIFLLECLELWNLAFGSNQSWIGFGIYIEF
jgi:hypothetical protein